MNVTLVDTKCEPQRRIVRLLAIVLSLTLLLSGCSFGKSAVIKESAKPALRVLRVGATAEPVTMDPTQSPAAAGPQILLYNVYETLVKINDQGQMEPLLARSWKVSSDRLSYEFTLDPTAKFADGTAVTSQAVKANIERVLKDVKLPILAEPMSVVKSVTTDGPEKVTVTLKRPSNNWLFQMSQTMGMIYNPSAFKDSAKLATETFGSGPYTLERWDHGAQIVLKKNPNYWGRPPQFDQVIFRYFKDPNAMVAAMLSGDLDVISNLAAPEAINKFRDGNYLVQVGTSNGEVVLGFNNARPVFKDLKVRQAITRAIDRAALLKTVWAGQGKLIGSMVPPTDPWYEDLTNINAYDPASAKALLKQANWNPNTVLQLKVPTLPYATKAAQFVASQLADVGIKVKITELVFPDAWLKTVYQDGDYDMTIVGHLEPRDIYRFADSNYYWHYHNPKFAQLLAKAEAGDEQTEIKEMQAAAKMLAEDAPAVWLFLLPNIVISRANIGGVHQNATSLSFDITDVYHR